MSREATAFPSLLPTAISSTRGAESQASDDAIVRRTGAIRRSGGQTIAGVAETVRVGGTVSEIRVVRSAVSIPPSQSITFRLTVWVPRGSVACWIREVPRNRGIGEARSAHHSNE